MVHISGVFGHGNACPLECRPNLMAITPCDRPPGAHTGTPLQKIAVSYGTMFITFLTVNDTKPYLGRIMDTPRRNITVETLFIQ
jgi:hypothetical protein